MRQTFGQRLKFATGTLRWTGTITTPGPDCLDNTALDALDNNVLEELSRQPFPECAYRATKEGEAGNSTVTHEVSYSAAGVTVVIKAVATARKPGIEEHVASHLGSSLGNLGHLPMAVTRLLEKQREEKQRMERRARGFGAGGLLGSLFGGADLGRPVTLDQETLANLLGGEFGDVSVIGFGSMPDPRS